MKRMLSFTRPRVSRRWIAGVVVVLSCVSLAVESPAQSGLRDSLEQLDRNDNGEIDPDEITPLARPYLERVAETRRMSLERSYSVERWQEAARIYYAVQNGVAGMRIRPIVDSTVRPFGADEDEPLIPEFGLAAVKYPYTQDDLDEADRTLRRSDRNEDGYIDRREAQRAEWTHRNPFDDDMDNDNRLSRLELGQRYARRRLLDGASDELRQKAQRTGSGVRSEPERRDDRRSEEMQYWRRGGTRYYLTSSVMSRFDTNKNGSLDMQEAAALGIPAGRIDADRDGELSRSELYSFLGDLQDEAGGLSEALPGWFYELDANRDQQVAMSEFTEEWTDEKLREFTSLDANGDGLLTAPEVLQAKSLVGGSYQNNDAEVLPPRKTIISEIDVEEDYLIGDLNVQLSLTHTHTSHLDAYLTGPDGQRIELFTEVGGSDDHFDQTVFDDQSRYPITKARPPFKGTFQPEALVKRQPSLSQFNGKSIRGVWQLVIRCSRSDRFGMLHSWSLIVKTQKDMMESTAVTPAEDGPQESVSTNSSLRVPSERPVAASTRAPETRSVSTNYANAFAGRGGDQDERAKAEARQRTLDRYREYLERMKQAGREVPKEKQAYFRKLTESRGGDDESGRKSYDRGSYDKKSYDKKSYDKKAFRK